MISQHELLRVGLEVGLSIEIAHTVEQYKMADQGQRHDEWDQPSREVIDQCEKMTLLILAEQLLEVSRDVLEDVSVLFCCGDFLERAHECRTVLMGEFFTRPRFSTGNDSAEVSIGHDVVSEKERLFVRVELHQLTDGPARGEEDLQSTVREHSFEEVLTKSWIP